MGLNKGKKRRKCGLCGKSGHNRRKCKTKFANVSRPERTREVVNRLCSGQMPMDIRDELAKAWDCDPRTIGTYITEARELIKGEMAADLPVRKQQLVMYLWGIAKKAEAAKKYGDCVRAAQLLAKVDGLEAPLEVNTGPRGVIVVGAANQSVDEWLATFQPAGG